MRHRIVPNDNQGGRATRPLRPHLLLDQRVVISVRSDPPAQYARWMVLAQRSITNSHPRRPIRPNLLQPQRRVARVLFQQGEVLVGQVADCLWQEPIVKPILRGGKVPHSSVQRPALKSSSACFPKRSSFPASTSRSIWASQAFAACSSNQRANAFSSPGESFRTACSSSARLIRVKVVRARLVAIWVSGPSSGRTRLSFRPADWVVVGSDSTRTDTVSGVHHQRGTGSCYTPFSCRSHNLNHQPIWQAVERGRLSALALLSACGRTCRVSPRPGAATSGRRRPRTSVPRTWSRPAARGAGRCRRGSPCRRRWRSAGGRGWAA